MIRLGLRLTVGGGREAAVRLVITAAAVALGVGLLLAALAGINALQAQNARGAWLSTPTSATPSGQQPAASAASVPSASSAASASSAGASASRAAADPVWMRVSFDYVGNQQIFRMDVAATGPHSPVPPGISALPGPGQYDASPALARLLRSTPADELGDRYPGHQAGTIGPSALPSPNSMIIVIGYSAAQLSHGQGAAEANSFATTVPGGNNVGGGDTTTIRFILVVVALALLFPVLIFIGASTRLAAARREQRFSAMRLAGATPRQVSVIAAVESLTAAVAGTAAGFGVFYLLRPVLATIPFTGEPFWTADLSLGVADILLVAVGVPVAAAIAARLALRRVRISPLGVSRRFTPPPPRIYRLIPLIAGIAELLYFVGRVPTAANGQILAFAPGFLLIIAGLVIAGPWLTMASSRLMAVRTRRPAALIASRRLADDPRAAFRAVSGLIVALFVGTVAVAALNTWDPASADGAGANAVLVAQLNRDSSPQNVAGGRGVQAPPSLLPATLAKLRSVRGVTSVAELHETPGSTGTGPNSPAGFWISCAQLSRLPALGHCAAGAAVASLPTSYLAKRGSVSATTTWPSAGISLRELQDTRVTRLLAGTDGSPGAVERARTALETVLPVHMLPPMPLGTAPSTSRSAEYAQLADVVIVGSLAIAGCGLAVSVAGGMAERKRPFSLLRLTGAPLGVLRRVVLFETAVPLVVIAVISAGAGLLATEIYARAQIHQSLRMPGTGFYLIVTVGLVAALLVIAATLPLLNRITGPETARNE
jgi:hypothetical protein